MPVDDEDLPSECGKASFDVPTLAFRHDCGESTIWNEIRDGELESFLLRDLRRITPEQERRWIARKIERTRQRRAAKEQRPLMRRTRQSTRQRAEDDGA